MLYVAIDKLIMVGTAIMQIIQLIIVEMLDILISFQELYKIYNKGCV